MVTHATVCKSNLHQVLTGILSYANDNNNYAPPWEFSMTVGVVIWTNPVGQFVKDYLGGSDAVLNDPSTGPPYEFNDAFVQTNPRNGSPSPNQYFDWLRWPDATRRGSSPTPAVATSATP